MMSSKSAVAYIRTSSLGNGGEHKDSYKRQLGAITTYAEAMGFNIANDAVFYDKGISGATPATDRPQSKNMLQHVAEHAIGHVIFEEPSRLARDLLVQEVTVNLCSDLGIMLIASRSPDTFVRDCIVSQLVRHVVGAVSQFQRSEIVERLKHARNERLKTTSSKTLLGKPKVVGKKSRLEGEDAKCIKKVLLKWSKKAQLKSGDIAAAQRALTKNGIWTKNGEEVSVAQVRTWLVALRTRK